MNRKRILRRTISVLLTVFLLVSFLPTAGFAAQSGKLSVGKTYSGFKLISQKYIGEIQSTVMEFSHVKSGAKLLFLSNTDDNKVFSITFKTPATDNSGVNHIIEHSVLEGSAKYPVKSPFTEMMKRSLNTYLNAYTAEDRTVFPVASRNDKDFNNLMSVYLDGVFYPSALKDERIFMQEAGHYELDKKDSPLTFNGIVYNEMKGSAASEGTLLSDKINESLFPDTQYKWNSGGAPESIPDLTWQKFKETYKKYYYPANSYIYLYGNLNIEKTLNFIDKNYLSKFSKKKDVPQLKIQKPFSKQKDVTAEYDVPKNTDTKDKSFISLNYAIDGVTNKDDLIGLMFLNYMLLGGNGSPLKSALINNGIGSDVSGDLNIQLLQPTYSIVAQNTDAGLKDKFQSIISNTLKSIVKNGLDKNLENALIHNFEINARNSRSDAYRGINYNDLVLATWIYGQNPTQYLALNDISDRIKKSLSKKYFENLISKYLLNNKHNSIVVLKPEAGMETKEESDNKAYFAKVKAKMTEKQIDDIVAKTASFKKWEDTPNTKEALSTLPSLSVSDISKTSDAIPLKNKTANGVAVLTHPMYTNRLVYGSLYFDASGVKQEQLPYLYLLSNLLGGLDTNKHSYMEIQTALNNNMGEFSASNTAIPQYNNSDAYKPKFDISFSTLDTDLNSCFVLIKEIVNDTKYDNYPLLKQYIKMIRSYMDNGILDSGSYITSDRVESYFSETGKYNNVSDMEFYKFMIDLDDNFDKNYVAIAKNLEEVADDVFNKDNLTASVTCDENLSDAYLKDLGDFAGSLGDEAVQPQTYSFTSDARNEGIMSSSQVQYIAKGYDISKLGYTFNGKMQVLSTIINVDYLWNKIREIGGAYGGSFNISEYGIAMFSSWSDPNLKETLDTFDNTAEFLNNFNATQEEMDNYIISTIGSIDQPLSPEQKGQVCDYNYFSGITQADIQRERDEILSTKLADIKNYAELIKKLADQNYFCVFGNRAKILENQDIFNSVTEVIPN